MKKAGWSMTALFSLFMLVGSAAPKLLGAQAALDSMAKLEWPPRYLFLIGIIEITCTILFVLPRTALLGAILMTGLFGGALASHWRADSPLFSHTLFSIYLGAFMWSALWLRDSDVRRVFPFIKNSDRD